MIKDKFYLNILSLDRSRSTVTNKYLANKYNAIALGEVARVISPRGNEKKFFNKIPTCSCGVIAKDCSFWGDIIKSINKKYKFLDYYLKNEFSFVESSKTIKHSKFLRENIDNKELISILLIRNFGEWSNSIVSAMQRNNEGKLSTIFNDGFFVSSNIRLYLRRFLIFRYFEYMLTNIRLVNEALKYKNSFLVTKSSQIENFKIYGTLADQHILRGNRAGFTNKNYKKWECNRSLNIIIIEKYWSTLNTIANKNNNFFNKK